MVPGSCGCRSWRRWDTWRDRKREVDEEDDAGKMIQEIHGTSVVVISAMFTLWLS